MLEAVRKVEAGVIGTQEALSRLLGLAVFGEVVAAETYVLMSILDPKHAPRLRAFAATESRHAASFNEAGRGEGLQADRAFSERMLSGWVQRIEEQYGAHDFDALAVLQAFVIEGLAIATYQPIASARRASSGAAHEAFRRSLDDEREHVEWLTRYLRLRYFEDECAFLDTCARVNGPALASLGKALARVCADLGEVGGQGLDCVSGMMVHYRGLLDRIGADRARAALHVEQVFRPVLQAA